jgi:hypothetical protein
LNLPLDGTEEVMYTLGISALIFAIGALSAIYAVHYIGSDQGKRLIKHWQIWNFLVVKAALFFHQMSEYT